VKVRAFHGGLSGILASGLVAMPAGTDWVSGSMGADLVQLASPTPCGTRAHASPVAVQTPVLGLVPSGTGVEISWQWLEGPARVPVEVASWDFPLAGAVTTLVLPLVGLVPDRFYQMRLRRRVQGVPGAWLEVGDSGRGWLSRPERAVVLPAAAATPGLPDVSWPVNIQPAAEGVLLEGRLERLDDAGVTFTSVATASWRLRGPAQPVTARGLRSWTRYRLLLREGARVATLDIRTRGQGEPALSTPTALVWPP